MNVAEWVDTYGIHHWRILWKMAWVGFEPTINEFRSDAVTDWAIRPWVQLALRANFVQLLQFYCLFSVTFNFGYCLRQSPRFFLSNFFWGNHMSVADIYIYININDVCVCVSVFIYKRIYNISYTLIVVNIFLLFFHRLMLFKVQSCVNLIGRNRKEDRTQEEKKSFSDWKTFEAIVFK